MDANVIPAELHIGSIGHWSPWYKLFFTTFLHFWTIFIILTTNLLIVDFFCRLIGGAGSPMMLKSGSFSSTWTLATTFFTHTYCTSPRFPSRLAPCPPLPSTLPQNETHSIETIPPTRSKSAYHTRPRHASHVPLRQGARHWAPPHPHLFCAPPACPCPPVPSIISAPRPPSHSPQRHLTQRKEKAKRGEKNTAATMQNSAGRRTSFCPQPCLSSPRLSCKHTLFSRGTTAQRLGGWNRGVVLSKAV